MAKSKNQPHSKRTGGRPSSYTEGLADEICDALINGESMRQICVRVGMPNRSTVLRWMAANEEFAAKCARARELQSDLMDDLVLETALSCTPETAVADRVKISAFQWRASKLAPKKYGDRVVQEHVGRDGGPIEADIDVSILTPEERAILRKAVKDAG